MSNRQYFTWSLYFGLQSKGNIRLSFPAHNTTSIAHTDSVVNAKRYVNTSVSALSKCWRTAVRHCIDRLHFHALTYLAGKSVESLQSRQLVCRFFIFGIAVFGCLDLCAPPCLLATYEDHGKGSHFAQFLCILSSFTINTY